MRETEANEETTAEGVLTAINAEKHHLVLSMENEADQVHQRPITIGQTHSIISGGKPIRLHTLRTDCVLKLRLPAKYELVQSIKELSESPADDSQKCEAGHSR